MALVDRIPEIPVDSPVYFYALDMLRDPGNREVFCAFPTDARRAAWMIWSVIAGKPLVPERVFAIQLSQQWLPEILSRDEMFPASEGLEGESNTSRDSSSDECQMSVVRDAICNEIAAAHGNARLLLCVWNGTHKAEFLLPTALLFVEGNAV
ncbi:hypothetical protein QJS10_CPA07g00338 [Acorus calamus]|uniref:Uncharacterized protein n=1 Tax=Acorus calamus TaxID=4465 RepID=A0AAV9EGC2_ACOCL|nr:hypothetical protein QJS10_CPA07g00338 [Acorus calamus]